MAEDDLDLFLALATEPVEAEDAARTGSRSPRVSAGGDVAEDDALDLFLKLADDDTDSPVATRDGATERFAASDAPQALAKQQERHRQTRLSGYARSGGASAGGIAPGVIPSNKPLVQQTPPVAQPRPTHQHSAFRVFGSSQEALQPQQQPLPGRQGVFKDIEQGSIIERLSGLKIKNPVVSSAMVRARLSDASVVKLGQVRARHRSTGLEGSWATICVIGEKSKPRESQSGRPYSIWKVTDLDQTSHSLFLFGGAHGDLWKESVGTLVALFSPKVKSDGDFSLSIDSSEQLWVLGRAPEFGYCKATKKNGDPCRIPVNALRCPFCPYHIQSEYNRLKPTRRNEFQETNLKTAFRPGMTRGLQWQVGQFAGDGPRAIQPRMPVLPTERLESTAEAAWGKGSSTGARYLKTVANPGAAAAAHQQREVLSLRHNRLGPGEAPIPLPRPSNVVLPVATPSGPGQGGGGMLVSRDGKRKQGGAADAAHAGALPAKRRAQQAGGGAGEQVLLECDLFEDGDARRRAVELLRSLGGIPAPDPNSSRPGDATAAARRGGAQGPRTAHAGAAGLGSSEPEGRCEEEDAGVRSQRHQQGRGGSAEGGRGGTPGAACPSPIVRVSPLNQMTLSSNAAGPSETAFAQQQRRRSRGGGTPAQQEQEEGRDGGEERRGSGVAMAASTGGKAVREPAAAAAARVASRGHQPGEPGRGVQAKERQPPRQQGGGGGSRGSIMGKLGIKPGSGGGVGQGSRGVGKQGASQPAVAKSAFEAAFGSVIREMEATAGAQTTSRYQSTVDEEDHDRIHRMLSVLEKKDEMAQKMDAVKSLTVTAFHCKQCSYTSERRRPECGEHSHMVDRVQVSKRWWECEHCKYRFSSVGVRYPAKRCSKCQHPQSDFKAVSMYRPAKQYEHETAAVASRDKLMARGVEQKWVMS